MRLIDADKLIKSCQDEKGVYFSYEAAVTGNAIDKAPTVDAVPVVRCKDCRWYKEDVLMAPMKFCFRLIDNEGNRVGYITASDDFCSHGKRKGGNE